MAQTLSRLQILLHADTANFRREMRGARDEIGGFGGFAKKAMGAFATTVAAGASAAAVAVGGIVKQQLSAASEIQKFSQLANTTTDQFQRMAAGAQSYGIGSEQLASTLKDVNDKVGDFLTTGGGEMADFFEKIAPKVGVTAEQFRGLSGADALQLYYSSLEKANLSQAEMVFYLESIADDATSLQPLLANGGAEMKKYGDAAQQAGAIMSKDTIAGAEQVNAAVGVLKTQFAGLSVQVFTAMLPSLQQLSTWITNNRDGIQQFATAIGQGLSAIGSGIGTAISVIGTFASKVSDAFNTVSNFVNDNKEAFIALGSALGAAAVAFGAIQAGIAIFGVFASGAATVAALSGALTAITTVIGGVGAAIAIITSPITIAVAAIAALTAAGVYLYRNWDEAKAKALVVWDAIGGTVAGVVDSVSQKYQSMVGAVSNAMSSIASKVSNGWATVKGIFATQIAAVKAVVSAGVSVFSTIFGTQFAIIKTVVTTAFNVIKAVVNGDMQGVKNAISNGFSQTISIVKTAASNVLAAFRDLGTRLYQIGADAINGLLNGIKSRITAVTDSARNMAQSVAQTIKTALDIRSPSRVTHALGEHAGQGLANGLASKKDAVQKAASDLAKQVSDSIEALKRDAKLVGKENDPLAALEYDIQAGKYAGVSAKLLDDLKAATEYKKLATDIYDANKRVEDSLKDMDRQIALMGNDNPLSEFLYDLKQTDKYANVSKKNLEAMAQRLQNLERAKIDNDFSNGIKKANDELAKNQFILDNLTDKYAELRWDSKVKGYTSAQIEQIVQATSQSEAFAKFVDSQKKIQNALDNNTNIFSDAVAKAGNVIQTQGGGSRFTTAANAVGNVVQSVGNSLSAYNAVKKQYQDELNLIQQQEDAKTITQEQAQTARLKLQKQYEQARGNLAMDGAETVAGTLSSAAKAMFGEQSKAYRFMFALEKGVSIARSLLAIKTGIAMAAANPFPANLGAMVSVATSTASIVGDLMAIKNPVGQAHDGIMSVPESGTWNLRKGERVLPEHTANRLDRTLDDINGNRKNYGNGQVNIVFENHTSATISQAPSKDGEMRFIIRDEIDNYVPQQLSRTNSAISQALLQNTTATRRV